MTTSSVIICASGIFFFYFYYGILQEALFRGTYGDEKYTFVVTTLTMQCVVSVLTAFLALMLKGESFGDVFRGGYYPLLSANYLGAMLCSNWALQYVSYPTQVIGKSCKPIPIMIVGVLFAGKKYSIKKYFFVLMIVLGVALFTYKDAKPGSGSAKSFSVGTGELLLLASLAQDGVIGAIQDRMKSSGSKPSPYQLMFSMNIWAILLGFAVSLGMGEFVNFTSFVVRHPESLSRVCQFCACSALGQVFIYKSVTELSPLTCSIITTTRKCFTVLTSVLLFGNSILPRQWAAVFIVFSGLFLDNYFSIPMSLADLSRKRKEELLSLRSKLKKTEDTSDVKNEEGQKELPRPKFRSYQPKNEALKNQVLPAAKPEDLTAKVSEDISKRQTASFENVDITDLAPRKPDWDLKRALESKLKKLDRRTERAIAEIVRERLQREAQEEGVVEEMET